MLTSVPRRRHDPCPRGGSGGVSRDAEMHSVGSGAPMACGILTNRTPRAVPPASDHIGVTEPRPPTVERIPAVLDVPGLARLLGLTEAGARALCRRGAIPARIPPGTRSYLVLGSDVLAWIQGGPRRTVEKRPDPAAHIRGLAAPRRRPRMRSPMPSDATGPADAD